MNKQARTNAWIDALDREIAARQSLRRANPKVYEATYRLSAHPKPWNCKVQGHVWIPASVVIGGKIASPFKWEGFTVVPQCCNYCFRTRENLLSPSNGRASVYTPKVKKTKVYKTRPGKQAVDLDLEDL